MSVADCFDAMASDRPYRERMEKSLVLKIIRDNSGTQFDPEAVEAFFRIVDQMDGTD
jgi:HD-GYP domain-containing protein (c-di-GMP phosphodiesterase class II)